MYQPITLFIVSLLIIFVVTFPANENKIESELNFDYENDNLLNFIQVPISSNLTAVELNATLRYTFGKRIKPDRLVSQNTDRYFWPLPKNVTLILQYPEKGNGAIVTFVEVIVNQSSNIGGARVIAGGIGKRYIASIIESNRTFWFEYTASIYGI